MENRPVGRKKNVTEGGSGVHKRGEGLGTGPVGNSAGYSSGSSSSGGGGGPQRSGGRSPLFMIIIILFLVLGGGGGLSSFLGGGGSSVSDTTQYTNTTQQTQPATTTTTSTGSGSASTGTGLSSSGSSGMSILGQLLGGGGYGAYSGASSGASAAWSADPNTGRLNTSVSPSARAKRTVIKGNGEDVVTIMVYMCGADLESRSGMASRDIQEMLGANLGDNVNLIIYTGGAKQWQNNVISSSTNQIYQIKNGQMALLKDNLGNAAMTKPETLSGYINWAAKNFPANRNILIFWDHGGGSTGGYGYDEKFPQAGAMSLAGINKALKDGGVTFDMVGFDTCLMATVENALVVSNYSDYLVASEETEPGIGWYYTNWLNALGKNTSMETVQIGKNIIDDFTDACARNCPGQKTTLSLIDLAELSETVPAELADFSKDTSEMINGDNFQTVSGARSSTREFAQARIDQVDLVDFATRMDTAESKELASALRDAIKYNKTSSNMTNAYGLSIYFPYKKSGNVQSMLNTYDDIGMDEDYAKCIASFASMGTAGQVAAGGSATGSPVGSIFGDFSGSTGSSGAGSAELITQLLTTFLSSDFSSVSGLTSSNSGFIGKSLDVERAAEYIANHSFDQSALFWSQNAAGEDVIKLSEDQWSMVQDLELNMFYDDGEGYVDLGLDNIFDFDDEGNLKSQTDKTWMSIDGQVVAYYVIDVQGTSDSYAITGRVPCYINGVRSNLILVFDSENEDGYVAGACYDYVEGETETVAKNTTELAEGDVIDFVCDYYGYDKSYQDSYYLGEPMTVKGSMSDMTISNTYVGDGEALVTYRFTDIYGQDYWTDAIAY
ncbi:clostripain-related cysteine peptidase [Butyrivibrio sp. XPD2006]|uniref:clostripain-related cysteine peptidase n=1 Tax=Butyrivibrio sp. XPD2006 TaxID=1280668 RepID=UPI0003B65D71|nr:clostripain-related cysteine peptidase [Butyrivibrio sp. XPD2006]